jgi:hypothetical protein
MPLHDVADNVRVEEANAQGSNSFLSPSPKFGEKRLEFSVVTPQTSWRSGHILKILDRLNALFSDQILEVFSLSQSVAVKVRP